MTISKATATNNKYRTVDRCFLDFS
jgi:hypothetical protein